MNGFIWIMNSYNPTGQWKQESKSNKTIYKAIKGWPWNSVEVNYKRSFFMDIVGVIGS